MLQLIPNIEYVPGKVHAEASKHIEFAQNRIAVLVSVPAALGSYPHTEEEAIEKIGTAVVEACAKALK